MLAAFACSNHHHRYHHCLPLQLNHSIPPLLASTACSHHRHRYHHCLPLQLNHSIPPLLASTACSHHRHHCRYATIAKTSSAPTPKKKKKKTVIGGNLTGFRAAVLIEGGSGHVVRDATVSHNRLRGVTGTEADFLSIWPDFADQIAADQVRCFSHPHHDSLCACDGMGHV
jgi:hypothetical protein